MRQRVAAETRRIETIRNLCAGRFPKVEAQAIEEGWDETKTELAILRASRPQVASTASRPRNTGPQVFEAVAR